MTVKVIQPCLFCNELGSSRDHVLPKMFGTFENNLINHDVCGDCNRIHFGRKLETHFGRNSAEAIFRLIFGAKRADEAHHIGGDRVMVTYMEEDEFRGARLRLAYDGKTSVQAEFPPQVLIHHKSLDVPRALLEEEITPEAIAPFLHGSTIWIPGDLDETTLRLRAEMEKAGFVFVGDMDRVPATPRDTREFLMRVDAVVDDAIAREMTKIAVNFLAVTVGYEFAMREEFRPMRKYARYGDPCLRGRVHSFAHSIELDGTRDRYGDGHLITLDWSFATSEVIVLISLFNRITHQVNLADNVKAVWWNIRTAYHFDTATREAKKLEVGPGEHLKLIAAHEPALV
jgi:hypothetical protein